MPSNLIRMTVRDFSYNGQFSRHHLFGVFRVAHNALPIPQINRRQSQNIRHNTNMLCGYFLRTRNSRTTPNTNSNHSPFCLLIGSDLKHVLMFVRWTLCTELRNAQCSSSVLVFGGRMATKAIFHFVADRLCLNCLCALVWYLCNNNSNLYTTERMYRRENAGNVATLWECMHTHAHHQFAFARKRRK